jgi:uncharacterized protein
MDRLPAGHYGRWVVEMEAAIAGTGSSEVACGTCTGCCTSSQFIHIRPDETDVLTHIPKALLFPAPHLPTGYMVMGYDDRGHCPMLVNNACSIYEHRPQTCQTYDCRIFEGVGVTLDPVDEPTKTAIAATANRWSFTYLGDDDRAEHEAARSAARYLRSTPELRPLLPHNTTQLAVLAFELRDLFRAQQDPDTTLDAVRRRLVPDN